MASDDQGAEMRMRADEKRRHGLEEVVRNWMSGEQVHSGTEGRVDLDGVLAVIKKTRGECHNTGDNNVSLIVFLREMSKALRAREADNVTLRDITGKLSECVVCTLFSIADESTSDGDDRRTTRGYCVGFMIDVICAVIRITEGNTYFKDV